MTEIKPKSHKPNGFVWHNFADLNYFRKDTITPKVISNLVESGMAEMLAGQFITVTLEGVNHSRDASNSLTGEVHKEIKISPQILSNPERMEETTMVVEHMVDTLDYVKKFIRKAYEFQGVTSKDVLTAKVKDVSDRLEYQLDDLLTSWVAGVHKCVNIFFESKKLHEDVYKVLSSELESFKNYFGQSMLKPHTNPQGYNESVQEVYETTIKKLKYMLL